MHDPGARRPVAGDVAEHDLLALDDGPLHGVEVRRRLPGRGIAAVVPAPGVDDDRPSSPPRPPPGSPPGSARTSLRSAARTSGVADDDGPATRNRARASSAVRPLRSVRPPPASRHPPPRPCREYTGRPAVPRASRSRRAVRSDTSSSSATSAAVTWPRCWSRSRMATSRSARTAAASRRNRSGADRFERLRPTASPGDGEQQRAARPGRRRSTTVRSAPERPPPARRRGRWRRGTGPRRGAGRRRAPGDIDAARPPASHDSPSSARPGPSVASWGTARSSWPGDRHRVGVERRPRRRCRRRRSRPGSCGQRSASPGSDGHRRRPSPSELGRQGQHRLQVGRPHRADRLG